jgi:hypothetical protein
MLIFYLILLHFRLLPLRILFLLCTAMVADGGESSQRGSNRRGDDNDEDDDNNVHVKYFTETIIEPKNLRKQKQQSDVSVDADDRDIRSDLSDDGGDSRGRLTPISKLDSRSFSARGGESKSSALGGGEDGDRTPLLHSGALLGDLPSLSANKSVSPGKQIHADLDAALNIETRSKSGLFASPGGPSLTELSRKADEKAKKTKKKKAEVPKDVPKEFLCQLTQKVMSEPVKSRYNNIYDKSAILSWIASQGHICPLTGM